MLRKLLLIYKKKGSVTFNGDGKNRYPHRLLQLWRVLDKGKVSFARILLFNKKLEKGAV